MSESKVILLSLVRTFLNEDYQLTDKSVLDVIGRKKAEGWSIGLSSDTPLLTLGYWYNMLGLNGPMVVEKGAAAWYPEDDALIVFTKADRIVEKARRAIVEAFLGTDNVLLVHGDATAFVRGVHEIPAVWNKILVAFNGLRKYSIAFHVRVIERSGKLVLDQETSEKIVRVAQEHLPASDLLSDGELDPEFGFFYMNPIDVTKATGDLEIFRNYKGSRNVVIGDSMDDFVDEEGVEVYAVGNSYPDFKAVAHKVASAGYASGVKELLLSL